MRLKGTDYSYCNHDTNFELSCLLEIERMDYTVVWFYGMVCYGTMVWCDAMVCYVFFSMVLLYGIVLWCQNFYIRIFTAMQTIMATVEYSYSILIF